MAIGKLYPGRLGAYDSGCFGREEEWKSRIGSEQKGLLAKKTELEPLAQMGKNREV